MSPLGDFEQTTGTQNREWHNEDHARFTKAGRTRSRRSQYEKRTSRISNPDGTVVFEMNDAEIPVTWSQLATDIMVSKYFRKAGVPQTDASGKPLLR